MLSSTWSFVHLTIPHRVARATEQLQGASEVRGTDLTVAVEVDDFKGHLSRSASFSSSPRILGRCAMAPWTPMARWVTFPWLTWEETLETTTVYSKIPKEVRRSRSDSLFLDAAMTSRKSITLSRIPLSPAFGQCWPPLKLSGH